MKAVTIAMCATLATSAVASEHENAEDQQEFPEAEVLPEASDEVERYRAAGDWTVYANSTRKTCFMTRLYDNGGAVQMGLTKDGDYGYIGVFVKGAEVEGDIRDVTALINGNTYTGKGYPATHLEGGYQGGYILANNTKLRHDLAQGEEMVAFPDTGYGVIVDLKAAGNAIFEVRKCTEELQTG
jgi:hypothetical protein